MHEHVLLGTFLLRRDKSLDGSIFPAPHPKKDFYLQFHQSLIKKKTVRKLKKKDISLHYLESLTSCSISSVYYFSVTFMD